MHNGLGDLGRAFIAFTSVPRGWSELKVDSNSLLEPSNRYMYPASLLLTSNRPCRPGPRRASTLHPTSELGSTANTRRRSSSGRPSTLALYPTSLASLTSTLSPSSSSLATPVRESGLRASWINCRALTDRCWSLDTLVQPRRPARPSSRRHCGPFAVLAPEGAHSHHWRLHVRSQHSLGE